MHSLRWWRCDSSLHHHGNLPAPPVPPVSLLQGAWMENIFFQIYQTCGRGLNAFEYVKWACCVTFELINNSTGQIVFVRLRIQVFKYNEAQKLNSRLWLRSVCCSWEMMRQSRAKLTFWNPILLSPHAQPSSLLIASSQSLVIVVLLRKCSSLCSCSYHLHTSTLYNASLDIYITSSQN